MEWNWTPGTAVANAVSKHRTVFVAYRQHDKLPKTLAYRLLCFLQAFRFAHDD